MTPPSTPPPASFSIGDIIFTLRRHKWKIVIFSLLGLVAAGVVWFTDKPVYQSNAKILVRYVTESRNPTDLDGADDIVRSPDARGSTVVASEVDILRSIDGIRGAVEELSASKILAFTGGSNMGQAVGHLAANLQIEIPKNSSVINVSLRHRDPEVAQAALSSIIKSYFRRHIAVHRSPEAYIDLQQQTEAVRLRLNDTEEELRRLKNSAEVITLPDAKREIAEQLSELQSRILESEAQLAEKRAHYENYINGIAKVSAKDGKVADGEGSTNIFAPNAQSSASNIQYYNHLASKLISLREAESSLLVTFTEESQKVKEVRQQITQTERALDQMGLVPGTLSVSKSPASTFAAFDANALNAEIAALVARYGVLTNQYSKVRERSVRLDGFENRIQQLQRKKDREESQFTLYSKSLEEARIVHAIDATRLNNISVIQEPTFGVEPDRLRKMKLAAAVLGIGMAFGIGLAFLIDFVFDTSVKRTRDLEESLQIPVLASVPCFGRNGHSKLKRTIPKPIGEASRQVLSREISPWDESDPMLPYYEAIRDRIVMSYGEESHKPKVVAVTSCNSGAGVSRIATGLAASLSRDVQRNVLLIGLEKNKVTVSAFAKGLPSEVSSNSVTGAADPSSKDDYVVEQNLYALAATGRGLSGSGLVQSFCDLMPKLRASEYDFIIFDLPPISQTGGALRLASQMERTLLVAEADKTEKGRIKRVKNLLQNSKTQLFCVLNKSQPYGLIPLECAV